jgi:hypothetical protein
MQVLELDTIDTNDMHVVNPIHAYELAIGMYVLLPGGFGEVIYTYQLDNYIRIHIYQHTRQYGLQLWRLKSTMHSVFWVLQ